MWCCKLTGSFPALPCVPWLAYNQILTLLLGLHFQSNKQLNSSNVVVRKFFYCKTSASSGFCFQWFYKQTLNSFFYSFLGWLAIKTQQEKFSIIILYKKLNFINDLILWFSVNYTEPDFLIDGLSTAIFIILSVDGNIGLQLHTIQSLPKPQVLLVSLQVA